jgi:hypothetical protein
MPRPKATLSSLEKLPSLAVEFSTENKLRTGDKSQMDTADSPVLDRIAFTLCFLETGLRICPPEKSHLIDRVHWRAVRSLQSGL